MLKRYLIGNLVGIPLHLFLIFMFVMVSLMAGANHNNWLASFTTVITVCFFLSLVPNVIVFIKFFDDQDNISGFCVSSIYLYFSYFIIINGIGYFVVH